MSTQENQEKITYFQFGAQLDYPIFIGVSLEEFDSSLTGFLTQCGFDLLTQEGGESIEKRLQGREHGRLLKIDKAGMRASQQIMRSTESDRFGNESVVSKEGYRVYRYRGLGLLIFSFGATQWTLGVTQDFGTESALSASRSIVNRYLSWALSPIGVAGFWGTPVDEGVVLMKQGDAGGEAVFFDVLKNRLLCRDGAKPFSSDFKIIRLDTILKNRSVRMGREEMPGFLSVHSTYMSTEGLSLPIRQVIQTLSMQFEGHRFPKENFQPRPIFHV